MATHSGSRLVFINTVANILGQIWAKILAFLVVPFLVGYLDEDRFGIYALGLSLMVLGTLLDPGMKYGYIKVFAEFLARGRGPDIRRLVAVSMGLYLAIGAAMFGLFWALLEPVMRAVGVPEVLRPEAGPFFLCMIGSLFLVESFSVFRHALMAMQRMTRANALFAIGTFAHYGLVVLAIVFDWGLRGIGWVFIAASVFQGALYLAAWLPERRKLEGSPSGEPLLRVFGYMMRFAWGVKIATNCNTTVMHLDKIFISRFVSLAAAGSYQIGSTLAVAMREFMRLSVSALLPAVAAMAARGDMARLRQVNRQASRVFVAVATPLFFFIAATAPLVIQAWLGAPGADSATALRLLSLAFYVNVAMAASMEIGAALHLSSLQMWTALGASLLNVVLNYFFVLRFGFVGPPIASILTLGLGSLVYMARLLRRLGEDTGAFFVHVALRPVLVGGAIALAMTWWTERHGVTLADGAPRATVLALLGGALAAGSVLYAVVLPVTGHLRPDDRRLIRRILGGQKGVAPTRPSDLPEE